MHRIRFGHRAAGHRALPWRSLLLTTTLLLSACGRGDTPRELPGASSEPAGAVRQLADHLQRDDLVGFARAALPPADYARLADAWHQDRSRWPLTELPLEDRIAPLLGTLAADGSEQALQREFERQFAGQDTALRDAARSLGLFGTQYLRHQGDYSDEERTHYTQIVTALSGWAAQAPLGNRQLARDAIGRLAAAARTAGLASEDDLRGAGMEETLRRLGPFLAEAKQVLAAYGLDPDRSLTQLRTGLVEENGDRATVRVHYPLGDDEIDTVVSLTRRDGHWYLTDYLNHAADLLAEPVPAVPADVLDSLPAPPAAELPAPPPADQAPEPAAGR